MKRSAILALLIGCCTFSFSQLSFSRKFQTLKKSVPLAIINSRPDCFYVLRYNKLVHDFTVERRAKPSCEIIGFAALKLDSVNANWFDYEKLDYLFFEQDKKIYFLFEKVLNTKKTIYLKIIDSLTKASGFIELASLENEKFVVDYNFEYKITTDNNILIVSAQTYFNSVKKTAVLFNTRLRKVEWVKKLPLENNATGNSFGFECNQAGDLFYFFLKSRVISYQRKYINHSQMEIPVFFHDSLLLVSYSGGTNETIHKRAILANVSNLNSVKILPIGEEVVVQAHYAFYDEGTKDKNVFFLNQKLSKDLINNAYLVTTPLNENVKKALTFYDGTDSKLAGDKEYRFSNQFTNADNNYQVSERREDSYYKELIVCYNNLLTGEIKNQIIIPRKVLIFKGRARLKNIGEAMQVFYKGQLHFIVLESTSNFKKPPGEFIYNKFRKENNLWGSNIVMYTINPEGAIEKKLVYTNSNFDLAPLRYQGNGLDNIVFYLSSGKYEEFAILQLNLF